LRFLVSPSTLILAGGEFRVTILAPRVRTIGVRLSQDEYLLLEKFCVETGAHSIAEVARNAINAHIQNVSRKSALARNASRSVLEMKDLQAILAQLTWEIAQLRAPTANSDADGDEVGNLKKGRSVAKGRASSSSNT
jgi:hypothetical protein